MSNFDRIIESQVTKRDLKKFAKDKANGYELDFDATKILGKIEIEIDKIAELGGKAMMVRAKGMLQNHRQSGDLISSLEVKPSKFAGGTGLINRRARMEWLFLSGGDKAPYAAHVELGGYYEGRETRRVAIPFMRRSAAQVRRFVRGLFISRLKRILK